MPKKGSKKSAPKAETAPPLPEEQPPRPDEAPPLPDEQPPLPTEQPPLPTEQPPLPNEQPPLPNEAPPLPTEQPSLPEEPTAGAEPVTQLGEGSDDGDSEKESGENDEGEEGGEDAGESEGKKDKGKGKEEAQPWQAVWAPEKNAYYFWNTSTGEVTWTNPLAPPESSAPPLPSEPAPQTSAGTSTGGAAGPSARPAGGVPEIDPALAHLLPLEQRGGIEGTQASLFNARTGKFTTDNSYAISHLDEYNRAKRFSEHYFDVDAWEKQKALENLKRKADEAAGVSAKKQITKKDMDRFRKKKQEQRARKQAWLHD